MADRPMDPLMKKFYMIVGAIVLVIVCSAGSCMTMCGGSKTVTTVFRCMKPGCPGMKEEQHPPKSPPPTPT